MARHNQKISGIFRCKKAVQHKYCKCSNCKSVSKIFAAIVYYSSVDLLFHMRTMVMKGAQTRKEFLY